VRPEGTICLRAREWRSVLILPVVGDLKGLKGVLVRRGGDAKLTMGEGEHKERTKSSTKLRRTIEIGEDLR